MSSLEFDLRRLSDKVYDRKSDPENPLLLLAAGKLTLPMARQFFESQWADVVIVNQVLLPRLLELSPGINTRARVWRTIYPEYGYGHPEDSGPAHFRMFLTALGTPADACPMTLPDDAASKQKIEEIEKSTWPELLGRHIGRATMGPKVFGAVEESLMRNLDIDGQSLMYFTRRAETGIDDCDALFRLADSRAIKDGEKQRVRDSLRRFLENEKAYCSNWAGNMCQFEALSEMIRTHAHSEEP